MCNVPDASTFTFRCFLFVCPHSCTFFGAACCPLSIPTPSNEEARHAGMCYLWLILDVHDFLPSHIRLAAQTAQCAHPPPPP